MYNPFEELYNKSSKMNTEYAYSLGTAKGYLQVIQKNPADAERLATECLELLEKLSKHIYNAEV